MPSVCDASLYLRSNHKSHIRRKAEKGKTFTKKIKKIIETQTYTTLITSTNPFGMLHVKHIISYLYSRYLIGLSFRLTIKILWVQLFNFDIFSTFEILNYLIALQNLRNFVCIHSGFRQNLLQCLTNSLLS